MHFERTTGGSHSARPGALSVGPERGGGHFPSGLSAAIPLPPPVGSSSAHEHPPAPCPSRHRHRPSTAPLRSVHPRLSTLPSRHTPHAMSRAPRRRVACACIALRLPPPAGPTRVSPPASTYVSTPDLCGAQLVHSARRITTAWAMGGVPCGGSIQMAASARACRMPVPLVHAILGGSAFGLALSRRPPGARTRLLR